MQHHMPHLQKYAASLHKDMLAAHKSRLLVCNKHPQLEPARTMTPQHTVLQDSTQAPYTASLVP